MEQDKNREERRARKLIRDKSIQRWKGTPTKSLFSEEDMKAAKCVPKLTDGDTVYYCTSCPTNDCVKSVSTSD